MKLVALTDYAPDAIIDMRYAGSHNIAGKPVSDELTPRLDAPAAQALKQIHKELKKAGYRLVIWDAYRTEETQEQLRAIEPDEQFVLKESLHCQGLAIDVTLATKQGKLLDMGTDHDDFSEKACVGSTMLTHEQRANRAVLANAFTRNGKFKQWPYEWWHFDFQM